LTPSLYGKKGEKWHLPLFSAKRGARGESSEVKVPLFSAKRGARGESSGVKVPLFSAKRGARGELFRPFC